ncbi:MBL fold metallo-hydrolase [Patescibacteria group bacterium]|nr:MBL fold metallo-hydrolase [Patescibacteria group bacterium]
MQISYLGWASFKIAGEGITLIVDPFDPQIVGLPWKNQEADVVCVSHQHKDHNYVAGVKGARLVIGSPGEYEVGGVRIFGMLSYHDDKQGQERGFNTMYRIELEEFSVAYLGDLGHKLTQEQVEDLGSIDVLILPVGGKYTINYETAAEVVAQLQPSIVIPSHYQVEGVKISEIDPVDKFLEEMGGEVKRVGELKLSQKGQLPEETEVYIVKS